MTISPTSPAIEVARCHYASQRMNLAEDLLNYASWGCVFIAPGRVLLGRPILRANGYRWTLPGEPVDTWFVKYACGRGALAWFIRQMPYPLPFIAWGIDFKRTQPSTGLRYYRTERLLQLLKAA